MKLLYEFRNNLLKNPIKIPGEIIENLGKIANGISWDSYHETLWYLSIQGNLWMKSPEELWQKSQKKLWKQSWEELLVKLVNEGFSENDADTNKSKEAKQLGKPPEKNFRLKNN